jgi:L,D-transpeptidase ErfK/SrfK
MKTILYTLLAVTLLAFMQPTFAAARKTYASELCAYEGFTCIKIKKGDTWEKFFPNADERKIVKRLNRTNTKLRNHKMIVVPDNLSEIEHMDLSPYPNTVPPLESGARQVIIKLNLQAFGAYDGDGHLVHWGPISGGKGWCPDVGRACNTKTGSFKIMRKGNASCASSKYPIGKGGAKMPYCMFYHGGYAMHGSTLPGHHASHGCIRMYADDAKWLNQEFTTSGKTRVIIE